MRKTAILLASIFINILLFFPVSAHIQDSYGCDIFSNENFVPFSGKCENIYSPEATYLWAKHFGLTTTQNISDFHPNSPITREEASAIIFRAFEKGIARSEDVSEDIKNGVLYQNPVTEKFIDQHKIAPEFIHSAKFVQDKGIIRGNRGYFYPKNTITGYESFLVAFRSAVPGLASSVYDSRFHDMKFEVHGFKDYQDKPFPRWMFFFTIRSFYPDFKSNADTRKIIRENSNVGFYGDVLQKDMPAFMNGEWQLVGYKQWDYIPDYVPGDFWLKISKDIFMWNFCGTYSSVAEWKNFRYMISPSPKALDMGNSFACQEEYLEKMNSFFDVSRISFHGFYAKNEKKDGLIILSRDENVEFYFERQ